MSTLSFLDKVDIYFSKEKTRVLLNWSFLGLLLVTRFRHIWISTAYVLILLLENILTFIFKNIDKLKLYMVFNILRFLVVVAVLVYLI